MMRRGLRCFSVARAVAGASAAAAFSAATALASCTAPSPEARFDSHDPRERTLAAIDAAERGDDSASEELVEMLWSADPVARMLAVRALHDLTGRSFGYEPLASEADRAPAAQAWRAFVAGRAPEAADRPMEDAR